MRGFYLKIEKGNLNGTSTVSAESIHNVRTGEMGHREQPNLKENWLINERGREPFLLRLLLAPLRPQRRNSGLHPQARDWRQW